MEILRTSLLFFRYLLFPFFIVRKECVEFFVVVMGVCNYCCLACVSSGDHGVVVGNFLVYLF